MCSQSTALASRRTQPMLNGLAGFIHMPLYKLAVVVESEVGRAGLQPRPRSLAAQLRNPLADCLLQLLTTEWWLHL